jgi:hypothetical protein
LRLARLLAIAAAALTILFALPALAHAATYCVNFSGCAGTAEPDLQTALNAASATTTVADTVMVGNPGAPLSGGYSYSDGSNAANSVNIVGAGPGTTVLTATGSGSTVLFMQGAGSTLSNLTLNLPAANATGLATYGSLDNVNITTADSGSDSQTGVVMIGNGAQRLTHLSVTLPASGSQVGVVGSKGAAGSIDLEDLSVVAGNAAVIGAIGIPLTVRRAALTAGFGLIAQAENVTVDNLSFRQLASGYFLDVTTGASQTATVDANHVSAYGHGDPGSIGILSSASGSGSAATVNVRNSIIRNFGYRLVRNASSGGTANASLSYSDFDLLGQQADSGSGTTTQGPGNIVADPLWVNPAAGDFHLQGGSPAIDAGDPAGLAAGDSTTDLAGNPRISNGRADMGAFEVQIPPPPPPVVPDTTAPAVTTSRIPRKLKLKQLLAGLTLTVNPSEPSSFDATLAGSAKAVTLARTYNVTLAHRKLGLAAGKRRITLKVKKRLLGRSRKFTLRLSIVAADASGNRRTIVRTIKVTR